jgi:DNA-binding response OmpR family regulator
MPDTVEVRRIGETCMMCRSGSGQPVILIAEQDLLLRFLVAGFLRAAGYDVIEVGNVEAMVPVFRAGTPVDLVFCDIHLACGKNDLDVLRRLAGHHAGVRVILTSACSGAAAGQTQAIEFMPKPYHMPDLAFRIRSLLRDGIEAVEPSAHTVPGVQSLQPA